jgi:hypothetical protein
MPRGLHDTLVAAGRRQAEQADDWMVAVEAVVAVNDDPEGMHRIKVLIPALDEAVIHDEWVTALVPWVGAAGYGPVYRPALGSEVLLFGRLGQPHSLFYLCRYNEDFNVPAEFSDGSRGAKLDTPYRLLCDLLIQILSESQIDVGASLVRLLGGSSEVVRVEPGKVGFLGSPATGKRALPTAATNLPSVIALANALRQHEIDRGFAE